MLNVIRPLVAASVRRRFASFRNSCETRRHCSSCKDIQSPWNPQKVIVMKKALVLVAEGTEEIEASVCIDVLRRAGVEVLVAGVPKCEPLRMSRQLILTPDIGLADTGKHTPYDVIVLPGGKGGTDIMSACAEVGELLKQQEECAGLIGAICAAPMVLKSHKIAMGRSLTSYPSFKENLMACYNYKEENVVHDGKLVTSRGPGTSFEFVLKLTELLVSAEKVDELKKQLLLP